MVKLNIQTAELALREASESNPGTVADLQYRPDRDRLRLPQHSVELGPAVGGEEGELSHFCHGNSAPFVV